jgi:hypothetical protein
MQVGHTQIVQTLAGQSGQIGPVLALDRGVRHKKWLGSGLLPDKCVSDLRPDLKSMGANARAQPNPHPAPLARVLSGGPALKQLLQHTRAIFTRQTAPPRVYGGHTFAVFSCQQHRQAIGHQNRADRSHLVAPTSVSNHWAVTLLLRPRRFDFYGFHTMHLLQVNRWPADVLSQHLAVCKHVLGFVAYMIAQVQAVEGPGRHAASALGHASAHPMRWVVGQEIGLHGRRLRELCH